MGNILLKGGRVIDPAHNFDRQNCDVQIIGSKIANVGKISKKIAVGEIIDCSGLIVCPGFIDGHAHSRTPGQEYKENLGSLSLAAIMGGYTSVICMPNTNPVVDNVETLLEVQAAAEAISLINIYQVSAITMGLAGKEFADLAEMKKKGAIAASDDGKGIQNPRILIEAMIKGSIHGLPILLHCEDYRFSPYDKRSEYLYIALVLKIAEEFGLCVHIQHVSCAESVQLIREAKARGVRVTCETAPHYFSLTQRDFYRIGANAKMNPPLRTESDRQEVIRGLADGTIDVIATDHAPHTSEEKKQPLDKAPFGIIGLETAVPVVLITLSNRIQLMEIIRKLTINPARILGLNGKGTLHPGSVADITVIDPLMRKKVEADKFQSLSRNCPWDGKRLQGWSVMTIVAGQIWMKDGILNI
ncbi:MAG: hypothetical protein A2Y67_03285 [Candidatus Buchananbacteria bacterium RBG_13_39_9]|uniref:Amidohydrolase-related domain-containing protein n=1 Tax=Candidatus Buchananbacteria bacterium RBG_13_39_9 TaxID=1797531 RepID=A0A1G1XQI0_9BACT|nr:MAG: hypothetical protein A2Y67_03285 [Candidatus Buchananbacteria bacterium RBG_13_39_9]